MSATPLREDLREWLEADGLGGFASGTVCGRRTRRYHALLLGARTPPTGRVALINGAEVHVVTPAGRYALSSQFYDPGVEHPDGAQRLQKFEAHPWPRWSYLLEDGTRVEHEVLARTGFPGLIGRWRLQQPRPEVRLEVRPLLSGRDYHATHHENPEFNFETRKRGKLLEWRPYPALPGMLCLSNGRWRQDPLWFRNFLYSLEQERGLDALEDLGSPGVLEFLLSESEAVWILAAGLPGVEEQLAGREPRRLAGTWRNAEEKRRGAFPGPLHRAADAYLVRRGDGRSLIAGYPWFTDWGRDTFLALRGLLLATGRLDEARDVLLAWTASVSEGMLPNRFPDAGDTPEYNSVDASLWFVVAAHEWLARMRRAARRVTARERALLVDASEAILSGYTSGTRFGIHCDLDGLLACGVPGSPLTWMDARVAERAVTPRIGKPVEVQALWLNALHLRGARSRTWKKAFERGHASFRERFWNATQGMLFDVVDVDHERGRTDASLRPNQLLAIGGLPLSLLEGTAARQVVDLCEARLWTAAGMRTLALGEPGYIGRYEGTPQVRDAAYHQGTAWPWLAGAFVEAWVRTHGNSAKAREEAGRRFVVPLEQLALQQGFGHLAEVADGDAPHTLRGCPFQAWSLGELLRVRLEVISRPTASYEPPAPAPPTRATRARRKHPGSSPAAD